MNSPNFEVLQSRVKKTEYALVIPVLNEGARFHDLLSRMAKIGIFDQLDVVIIDGRSTDDTINIEKLEPFRISATLRRVSPGKLGTQLQCAYKWVADLGYKGVVTIDGNNKDNPSQIIPMVKKLEDGFDFVQGSRFIKGGSHKNTPISRLIAIKFIHAPLLSISSGFHWTDTTQGFRAYSRRLLLDAKLNIFRPEFSDYKLLFFISHMAPKLGFRCEELGTERNYPKGEAVPTKIRGLSGVNRVLWDVLKVSFGKFDQ